MFLPGEAHGQRGLVGYSLWDLKESDMIEHNLKQKNALLSSLETESSNVLTEVEFKKLLHGA